MASLGESVNGDDAINRKGPEERELQKRIDA